MKPRVIEVYMYVVFVFDVYIVAASKTYKTKSWLYNHIIIISHSWALSNTVRNTLTHTHTLTLTHFYF